MKIENNSRIVFIGDSITDCGRDKPIGQNQGLGNGYVNCVNSLIEANDYEAQFEIINMGTGGNRIVDLEERWSTDVTELNPQWVSIMIGINDVWRQFDCPRSKNQVSIQKFESVYRNLLENTLNYTKGIILMTPFYIEKNPDDPMRKMMDQYSRVVAKLAKEYKTLFVDTQRVFGRFLMSNPTQMLCWDRVHPNLTGHFIIAKGFLNTIDFKWNY